MKLCIGDRPGKRFELSKDWLSCKRLLEAIWSERGLLPLYGACRLLFERKPLSDHIKLAIPLTRRTGFLRKTDPGDPWWESFSSRSLWLLVSTLCLNVFCCILQEKVCDARSAFHSKRLSPSSEVTSNLDGSPKIVEVDTFRPRSRFCQIRSPLMECVYDGSDYAIPTLNGQNSQKYFEWQHTGDECKTPTPVKSAGGDSFYGACSELPSYMANTQSFKAKSRSLSAPKQRPDEGSKKRLTLSEIIAARNSVSAIRMHRSYSQFEDIFEWPRNRDVLAVSSHSFSSPIRCLQSDRIQQCVCV